MLDCLYQIQYIADAFVAAGLLFDALGKLSCSCNAAQVPAMPQDAREAASCVPIGKYKNKHGIDTISLGTCWLVGCR